MKNKMQLQYSSMQRAGWLVCVMFIVMTSCKKFVQIEPPSTQLVSTSVFNNVATATAAQIAIYNQMASYGESYNIAESTGLLGDELTGYSTIQSQIDFFTDAMLSSDNAGPWNDAYNFIYQANAIISSLQNNSQIPTSISNQLIGESKFVRAFWHFYLTNLYGDVPLVTTTSYNVTESISRTPQTQVYRQIVADLNDAQGLLNPSYVDLTDTTTTTERVRPTKWAAAALLARVYLYEKKFDSAEMEASLVINNTGLFKLCTNLSGANSVFRKNSTEAIWQLSTPLPSSASTIDGSSFILISAPGTASNNCTTLSQELINSFDSADQRKAQWINIYNSTGTPVLSYYYPFKYQVYSASATSLTQVTEYVMVFRLAEQYLIRAEARAEQGEMTGAVSDLNTIRQRAGVKLYAGATDQNSLMAVILHERQVELFTEWGHRWLDLKRTASVDSVMGGPSGVCKAKNTIWNSYSQLFPIPNTDRINDANLTQNPGYQ